MMQERIHILLIDDEPDLTHVLSRLLDRAGYRVTVAHSVREAKSALASEHFDVAICDLNLPDGDGLELMCELRHQHQLPAIGFSGLGPEENPAVVAAGFSHLVKTAPLEEIQEQIQQVLKRS